jgi:membrane associated rhomboid family serine protease
MERSFIEELKSTYRTGGMFMKLIFINAVVFLGVGLVSVFAKLFDASSADSTHAFFLFIFGLKTDYRSFFFQPWGLFTSIFAHFGIWHFLMNMLFLFFAGKAFEEFFNGQRLLYTYILGGVFGGVFEVLAHALFPALQVQQTVVVGASGSVMAIFAAIAFYRPNLEIRLFGILPIRIIFLALFFIVIDLFQLGSNDGVAHFAHLGGVFLGFLSVKNIQSKKNIINWFIAKIKKLKDRINLSGKNKMKVVQKNPRIKTDEEYNLEQKLVQEEIDKILDKIARAGYDSLSKFEKDLLFKQSKK